MRIAMFGTRGVPAAYGGFETAVEEIGARLVERGHEVVVYCRTECTSKSYRGMELVSLPSLHHRALETLSHTAFSAVHALILDHIDAAIIFNAANAPLAGLLRAAGVPTAVHVDGLEWKRGKWAGAGRRYYLNAEAISVALADSVIADSEAIADYYKAKFGFDCRTIRYGAPILHGPSLHRLAELGLQPGGYHLAVARFEPENNLHVIAAGYSRSDTLLPLVVVGANPYPTDYTTSLDRLLDTDPRIRAVGSIYDHELLDAMYAGAATYSHGHSVGGTNPSLLRAMGAGTPTIAHDNVFNREVLDGTGLHFSDATSYADAITQLEGQPALARAYGGAARLRASSCYRWGQVADEYEGLCKDLVAGRDRRPKGPGLVSCLRLAPHVLDSWPAASRLKDETISLLDADVPRTVDLTDRSQPVPASK